MIVIIEMMEAANLNLKLIIQIYVNYQQIFKYIEDASSQNDGRRDDTIVDRTVLSVISN